MFFIIEGVTAAGKSCLLSALQNLSVTYYPKATKLFISEHFTQRNFEHLCGEENLFSAVQENLDTTLLVLEEFQGKLNQSKFVQKKTLLQGSIERFYLTYLVEGLINLKLAKEIAVRLKCIRCQQVILKIPPALIEERVFSTVKYRNQDWQEYLDSLGSRKQIVKYFTEWQKKLLTYAQEMELMIPTLYLNTEKEDWNTLAKTLYELITKGDH